MELSSFSFASRCDVDEFAFSTERRVIILPETVFAQETVMPLGISFPFLFSINMSYHVERKTLRFAGFATREGKVLCCLIMTKNDDRGVIE